MEYRIGQWFRKKTDGRIVRIMQVNSDSVTFIFDERPKQIVKKEEVLETYEAIQTVDDILRQPVSMHSKND